MYALCASNERKLHNGDPRKKNATLMLAFPGNRRSGYKSCYCGQASRGDSTSCNWQGPGRSQQHPTRQFPSIQEA